MLRFALKALIMAVGCGACGLLAQGKKPGENRRDGGDGPDRADVPDANFVPRRDGGDGSVKPDAGFSFPPGVSSYIRLPIDCRKVPFFTEEAGDFYVSCAGKPSALLRCRRRGGAEENCDRRVDFQFNEGTIVFHQSIGNGRYFVSLRTEREQSSGYALVDIASQRYDFYPFTTFIESSGDGLEEFPLDPILGAAFSSGEVLVSSSFVEGARRIGKMLRLTTDQTPWSYHQIQTDFTSSRARPSAVYFVEGGFLTLNAGTPLSTNPEEGGSLDFFRIAMNRYALADSTGLSVTLSPQFEMMIDPTASYVYALAESGSPTLHRIPRPGLMGIYHQYALPLAGDLAVTSLAYDRDQRFFVGNVGGQVAQLDLARHGSTSVFSLGGREAGFCRYVEGMLYCFVSARSNQNAGAEPQLLQVNLAEALP